jgi:hypothetical protein
MSLLNTRSLRPLQRSHDTSRTRVSKTRRRQSLGALLRLRSHQSGTFDSAAGARGTESRHGAARWRPKLPDWNYTQGASVAALSHRLANRERRVHSTIGEAIMALGSPTPSHEREPEEEITSLKTRPCLAQLFGPRNGTLIFSGALNLTFC